MIKKQPFLRFKLKTPQDKRDLAVFLINTIETLMPSFIVLIFLKILISPLKGF